MLAYAELGTLALLGLCSVLVLAVIIERFIALRRESSRQKHLQGDLRDVLESGDEDAIHQACEGSRAPLAGALRAVYEFSGQLRPDQTQILLGQGLEEERSRLRRFLGILATLAATAPFIGLFGTVLGIMHTFSAIAQKGFGGPAVVSAGISQALIATAAGLGVAIPAVIFYNYFNRSVTETMKRAQAEATQILMMFGRI